MEEGNGEHPFGDTGQLICLGSFLIVWGIDSFALHDTTYLSGRIPLSVRLIVSGGLLALGLVLFRSAHFIVRQEARAKGLVTRGIFHYVRHPLYLASLTCYLALVAFTMSLAAFILWVGIVCFHDFIAGFEEKVLLRKYGMDYRVYQARTGKWLPRMTTGR